MARSAEPFRTHYRIGVVPVTLTTSQRWVAKRYASMYAQCVTSLPHSRVIDVQVHPRRARRWGRRRYEITAGTSLKFEPARRGEVLPYIEWAVNRQVPATLPEYLHLHASSMEVGGMGVVLAGQSGSGKSTLTLGMLTRGWRYLCDEFALVHADTLMLHPFPRAICIKQSGYPVIDTLGIRPHDDCRYIKGFKGRVGFVKPTEVRPDATGKTCPVRLLIFPRYRPKSKPVAVPMSRGEAAFALHEVCFNLFRCKALGLDVIANMIRGASCYRLTSSDIQATCDVVEELARQVATGEAVPCARSA